MTHVWRNLLIALRAIVEQRQRTVLSALGVMVAMVAIIMLIGIARGVQKDMKGQVEDLGVNVVVVLPTKIDPNRLMGNPNLMGQSYLKGSHSESLKQVEGVRETAMLTFAGGGMQSEGKNAYPMLVAAEASWFAIRPVELEEGAIYDSASEGSNVCVIGGVAKRDLFGSASAIGKEVSCNGETYKVVGVTKDKSAEQSLFSESSFENVVYLPYKFFHKINPEAQTDRIMVQTQPDVEPKALVKRLESDLAKTLSDQQFSVLTQQDLLKLIYRLMRILTYLLTGLTSIALFVGGVGIMAIMLMSVNERTREIGIRMTVGARRSDIFWQFVIEAIAVSLLGGAVGLGFSTVASWVLRTQTVIKPEITPDLIGFGLGICVCLGTIFGILPALQAMRKEPVVALRAE